jgi:hypothetical protein
MKHSTFTTIIHLVPKLTILNVILKKFPALITIYMKKITTNSYL